jgi:hypothetical protein
MLEFTAGKMRVYKNGDILTVARTTLTAATKASTCVITVSSTSGLANGDEVLITGVVGMTELNNRPFKLAGSSGSTFQLTDPTTGTGINSTNYTAWSSGGTLVEIYEIATPYTSVDDLDDIQFAQTREVMYLSHYLYTPRKLTVSSDVFTIAEYTRTSNPWTAGAALTITSADADSSANHYITVETAGTPNGDFNYLFAGCEEVADLDGFIFRIGTTKVAGNYYYIYNRVTGEKVSAASTYTTAIAGGTATAAVDNPISVAFYESRSVFGGTDQRPSTLFMSRSPSSTGTSRFDDFTGGTAADNACFFSLAPVNGTVDYITWIGGTSKYLLVGTFGGVFRVSGGGIEEPIIPTSINSRQIDAYGCAATMPALNGSRVFFVQRGGGTVRSLKYDADVDDVVSTDLCINADQIGDSPIQHVVFQAGSPNMIWVIRTDGQLCGMTVEGSENVAGWHRHKIGGTSAKVLSAAILPRTSGDDQLYIVTERTVNGATQRAVEVMADPIVFPDVEDYFTDSSTESSDLVTYRAAVVALQADCIYMDAAVTYDSTAATTIGGLWHLEGERVAVLADGELYSDGLTTDYPTVTVASGSITLTSAASVVQIGLPYEGFLQTQNLEMGGRTGPAQSKPRNIVSMAIRFLNSLGCEYGTNLYDTETVDHTDDVTLDTSLATPVFSGIKKLHYSDDWSSADGGEKTVIVAQRLPLPCTVQFIDVEYDTSDEGGG